MNLANEGGVARRRSSGAPLAASRTQVLSIWLSSTGNYSTISRKLRERKADVTLETNGKSVVNAPSRRHSRLAAFTSYLLSQLIV